MKYAPEVGYRKNEDFFIARKIKNTHHSSGLALKAKNFSEIQPDECLTTHHILIRVLLTHFQWLWWVTSVLQKCIRTIWACALVHPTIYHKDAHRTTRSRMMFANDSQLKCKRNTCRWQTKHVSSAIYPRVVWQPNTLNPFPRNRLRCQRCREDRGHRW